MANTLGSLPSVTMLTQLRMEKFDTIESLLKAQDSALIHELGSQGFSVATDGTYACSHESTMSPLSYYHRKVVPVRMEKGVNMDRADIVRRADGAYSACVADGVGGDGHFSAFTAQMACHFLSKRALEEIQPFTCDEIQNKERVEISFFYCANSVRKHSDGCALKGSTTALFVDCMPTTHSSTDKKMYRAQGGSLGDGAIIHIMSEHKKARQLNTIHRKLNAHGLPNLKDTGGCMLSNGEVRGVKKISAFDVEIEPQDFLILTTDGFLDNVANNKVAELVELVMSATLFDQPIETLRGYPRPWETPTSYLLPSIEELRKWTVLHTEGARGEGILTAASITRRLATYVQLVTSSIQHDNALQYGILADYRDKARTGTPSLQDQEWAKEALEKICSCQRLITSHPNCQKPDDCVILTLQPGT